MAAIAIPALGLVGGPITWSLEQLGRLVLRVRPAGAPDQWYVLAPQVPNTITVGAKTLTVTVSLAVTAGAEIGASIVIDGGTVSNVDVTLFIDVGGAQPSFVLYQLGVGPANPLPTKTTTTVTVPASGLPSVTNLHIGIDAHGVTTGLGLGGGRINVAPAMQVAQLGFTATALATAVTLLGSRAPALISSATSLLGVVISPLGLPLGALPATVNVRVPSREANQAALTDPTVVSMTKVTAGISKPGVATFDLPTTTVDIAFDSSPTASDAYHYHAPFPVDVAVGLLVKTPVARDNLSLATLDAQLAAKGLPTDLVARTQQPPPIALSDPSPDPATAPPVLDYRADTRLPSIVGMVRSHGVIADPLKPAPALDTCMRFELTDLPRGAHVRSGQFDPNKPKDTYLEVGFDDAAGGADAPQAIRAAVRGTPVMPVVVPGPGQYVRTDTTDSLVVIGVEQLQHAELRVEQSTAGAPPHPQRRIRASYTAAAELPAHLEMVPVVGDLTQIDVDRLPKTFAIDLLLPELTTPFDSVVDWVTSAAWTASAVTTHVHALSKSGADTSEFDVHDIPVSLRLDARNIAHQTSVVVDGGTDQTGTVDVKLRNGQMSLEGQVSSLPAWARVALNRTAANVLPYIYQASHPIDLVSIVYSDKALTAPPTDGKPRYDHLQLRVQSLPATPGGGPPSSAGTKVPLNGIVDSSKIVDAPPIITFEVPGGVNAVGLVEFELTDRADRLPAAMPADVRLSISSRFGAAPERMPADAPKGRRVYAALPGLRTAELNMRTPNLPLAVIGATAARPLWAKLWFDVAHRASVDLATDTPDLTTKLIGTTWARVGLDHVYAVIVDGSLATTDGTVVAVESLPHGPVASGQVFRFDASPQPLIEPGAADAIELRKSRLDFRTRLPDRIEAKLDCRSLLEMVTTSEPRRGLQLAVRDLHVLFGPPGPEPALGAWLMLHDGFDDRAAAFDAWCRNDRPRAKLLIERTTEHHRDDLANAPIGPHERDHRGPPYLYTTHVTQTTAFARLSGLTIVELSTALSAKAMGQEPARFLCGRLDLIDRFPIEIRHAEDGMTTADAIDVSVGVIHERFQITIAPQTPIPEASQLASLYRIDLPGQHPVSVNGAWQFGFPNVEPIDPAKRRGAMAQSDGRAFRPMGLTAVDLQGQFSNTISLTRRRSWFNEAQPGVKSDFTSDDPRVKEIWRMDEDLDMATEGLDLVGHVVNERIPSPGLSALLAHPTKPQTIVAVQSPVRVVDYMLPESQLDNPFMARPGVTASPYAFAFNIAGLERVQTDNSSLVDQDGRSVPLFLTDTDSEPPAAQHGRDRSNIGLRLANGGPVTPADLRTVEFQEIDYRDAPSGPVREVVRLKVPAVPKTLEFQQAHEVDKSKPGKPTAGQTIEVRTFATGSPPGPPIGPASLTAATLDTATNIWVPAIRTVLAEFTALPNLIFIKTSRNTPIDRFPINPGTGAADPTKLSAGGWNTSRMELNCSGPISGNVTTAGFETRTVSNKRPSPFARPGDIKWSRTTIEGLTAKPASPPPNPYLLYQFPRFAVLTGTSGPANRDDEKSATGIYSLCNDFFVNAKIISEKQVGLGYPGIGTHFGPYIDPVTITLTNFSGELSIQKKDVNIVELLALALAPFLTSYWGWLAALLFGELVIHDVLGGASPIQLDNLCSGDWYIKPSNHALGPLTPIVDGLGHGKVPGCWDMTLVGEALLFAVIVIIGDL